MSPTVRAVTTPEHARDPNHIGVSMKIRAMTITMSVLAAGALMMQAHAGTPDPRAEQLWQQAIHTSSPAQEFALLLEAAKLGHPRAQAAVGSDYWSGWGVREDDAQAAYWLQLAAAQGNRGAQFNLAGMYTMGKGGLRVDLPRA